MFSTGCISLILVILSSKDAPQEFKVIPWSFFYTTKKLSFVVSSVGLDNYWMVLPFYLVQTFMFPSGWTLTTLYRSVFTFSTVTRSKRSINPVELHVLNGVKNGSQTMDLNNCGDPQRLAFVVWSEMSAIHVMWRMNLSDFGDLLTSSTTSGPTLSTNPVKQCVLNELVQHLPHTL